mmetsp:Transcript_65406/g.175471  ORF Transcript_65406/g.175471 Transcript_65406/m.175471 type:complete len:96 (-) Transcript_65406:198-485(-)
MAKKNMEVMIVALRLIAISHTPAGHILFQHKKAPHRAARHIARCHIILCAPTRRKKLIANFRHSRSTTIRLRKSMNFNLMNCSLVTHGVQKPNFQ